MQNTLPYLYGQIEYLEKNLNLLKEAVSLMSKNGNSYKKVYGTLPKTNLTFSEFKNLRKKLSSSWEKEWK